MFSVIHSVETHRQSCDPCAVDQQIFMFLAEAVAHEASGYRAGARHALMLFVADTDRQVAQARAEGLAAEHGWMAVVVERGKSIGGDATAIQGDVLRAAAEASLSGVGSIVVYEQEIPFDA